MDSDDQFPEIPTDGHPVEQSRPRRKFPWPMLIVVALFVIVPFISWYGTWFGRPLSDAKIAEYLNDNDKPRHIQQALEQIVDRLNKKDRSVTQFYPKVATLGTYPVAQIRSSAAWMMNFDPAYADFRPVLVSMLQDDTPTVRYQAALSLVSFGDNSGHAQIVQMLKPSTIKAEEGGVPTILVKEGAAFAAGAPIVRLKLADGRLEEIHAPLGGRVERLEVTEGAQVQPGQEVAVLAPEIEQVWEALRALYLIGEPDDIPTIQRYTTGVPGMPDRVQTQASLAVQGIHDRTGRK